VTRALRFLALITTLFVLGVRCLGGLPLVAVCAALPAAGVVEACPPCDEPREQDALAPIAFGDVDDDDAEPVVVPFPPRIRLLNDADPRGAESGAWAAQRVLSSHARNLERPPRV